MEGENDGEEIEGPSSEEGAYGGPAWSWDAWNAKRAELGWWTGSPGGDGRWRNAPYAWWGDEPHGSIDVEAHQRKEEVVMPDRSGKDSGVQKAGDFGAPTGRSERGQSPRDPGLKQDDECAALPPQLAEIVRKDS